MIFWEAGKHEVKRGPNESMKIENFQIKAKEAGDFVTSVDIKVEKILLNTLQQFYPNASYITEESDEIKDDEETIIIDPIDGTTNFIHGIPFVGIVIGRAFKGEITDGIIFNPILDEFYSATKGGGAWCNNKEIKVSKREKIANFYTKNLFQVQVFLI